MRKIKTQDGFTVVELVVLMILILLASMFLMSGCAGFGFRAFREEALTNLHLIQIALERYATDHDGKYPKYIMGGDKEGWSETDGCDAIIKHPPFVENINQTNREGGGARPPKDPLIFFGYLESYPKNPLVNDKSNDVLVLSGGDSGVPGSGDVRFGYDGTKMGNALDDPRFLWDVYPVFDQPDNIRLQPTRLVNTFQQSAYKKKIFSIHPENKINPFYSMGGMPDEENPEKTVSHWIPGEFLYRATGKMVLKKTVHPGKLEPGGILNIWDFEIPKYEYYILAAYGSKSTKGLDIIRLTTLDGKPADNHVGMIPDVYNRGASALYGVQCSVYLSTPEVFGGGGKGVAPIFPYFTEKEIEDEKGEKKEKEKVLIYGAPDGIPDGIIVYLNSEGQMVYPDGK